MPSRHDSPYAEFVLGQTLHELAQASQPLPVNRRYIGVIAGARRGRPPTAPWHNCETCGRPFKYRKGNANRFCSLPCRRHSEAFIEDCRRLWDRGLSASEVADRTGVSKNAIIGIAHRNGFSARPSPIRRAG